MAQASGLWRQFPDAAMTRILVTRHGEGEHNLITNVWVGRAAQAPLTALGWEQARLLGEHLAIESPPQRIICSSIGRTVDTAREINRSIGLDAIEPDDAFWELTKGSWEGTMPRVLPPDVQRELDADPFGYQYPEGESYRILWQRVAPAFDDWVARYANETILFVLHGDVIRALLYHIIRFPEDQISDWVIDPCSISEFRKEDDGRMIIVRINDTAHLQEKR